MYFTYKWAPKTIFDVFYASVCLGFGFVYFIFKGKTEDDFFDEEGPLEEETTVIDEIDKHDQG